MPTYWKPVLMTALAGAVIGWIDVQATDVQGSLLLLLLLAFGAGLALRTPAWLLAVSLVAGMFLANLASAGLGRGAANAGVLIALLPAMAASLFGRGLKRFIETSVREPDNDDSPAVPAPDSGLRASLVVLTLVACVVVGTVPVHAVAIARGQPVTWFVTIVWQVITFLAWAGIAGKLLSKGRSMNNDAGVGITPADVGTHCATIAGIVVLHAIVLPLATLMMHIPLGPGGMVNAATWAIAAYLPLDALTYVLLLAVGRATDTNRRIRLSVMREEAFRGQEATTRLASLHAQLRPHFLFNALNAGSVLAKRGDAAGAARVLTGLGDLLRYVLRGADDESAKMQFVTLDEELVFVDSYLALERERFPDRLSTSRDVSADVGHALVPHLLIQPLVENAVKHGIGARIGMGHISLKAWRDADTLHITVEDDGPGPGAIQQGASHGIGLANTRSRLMTLYGKAATLTLTARKECGASAQVTMPFTT